MLNMLKEKKKPLARAKATLICQYMSKHTIIVEYLFLPATCPPNGFLRLLRLITMFRLFANSNKSLQLAKEGTIGFSEDMR